MRQLILAALLAFPFGSPLFALDAAPEIQRILDRGTITVAIYGEDVYPLFYKDAGNALRGHDAELAKSIADALGVRLEVNRDAKSFDGVVDLVSLGKADLGISLISMTPARAMKVRFSDPYLVVHPVLIVNRRSGYDLGTAADVKKAREARLTICEKAGTSYVDMAKSLFPESTVTQEKDWNAALEQVATGKADAALRDEIGVNNYIKDKKNVLVELKMHTLGDINDYVGIAVNPGSPQLEHWVNVFLRQAGYPIDARTLSERYAK